MTKELIAIEELIAKLCPDGVEFFDLGEVCEEQTERNKDQSIDEVRSVTNTKGLVRTIDFYENNRISENTSNYKIVEPDTIVYNPSRINIGSIARHKERLTVIVSPMYVVVKVTDTDRLNLEYLDIFLASRKGRSQILSKVEVGARFRFTYDAFARIKIPLPPLPIQEEIVKTLNIFTELERKLEVELEARIKQYEYYLENKINNLEWSEMTILDMLSQPVTDGPHETPLFVSEGVPFISAEAIYDGKINLDKKRGYITKEYDKLCARKYKPQKNDVFMVKSGSTTGKVAIVTSEDDFNIWSPIAAMRVNKDNSPRFLFHLLKSQSIQKQVKDKASHGSQPNLGMRALEKFAVRVPPIEEQNKIADLLDLFEKLINDISIGLPAEINARRRQYGYYREKLLTFKELEK